VFGTGLDFNNLLLNAEKYYP